MAQSHAFAFGFQANAARHVHVGTKIGQRFHCDLFDAALILDAQTALVPRQGWRAQHEADLDAHKLHICATFAVGSIRHVILPSLLGPSDVKCDAMKNTSPPNHAPHGASLLSGLLPVLIFSLLMAFTGAAMAEAGSIVWGDRIDLTPPQGGGAYPRLVKIKTGPGAGDLLLFYQSAFLGGDTWMDRSHDGGKTWTAPEVVNARAGKWKYANCNVIQLDDGRLLMTFQRRDGTSGLAKDYFIDTRYSSDGGKTWGAPQQIFQGMNWEGRPIQVPHDANGDGNNDIYLFFTQQTVPTNVPADQATNKVAHGVGVAWIASYDNGKTWVDPNSERFTGRIVHRDFMEPAGKPGSPRSAGGMPTPFLIGKDRIAFVAEEIGKAHSPYVVASGPGDWNWEGAAFAGDWTSADYDGSTDDKVYPDSKAHAWLVSPDTFAAAPFAANLADHRIAVSANSKGHVVVWIGDETGHGFVAQDMPFDEPMNFFSFIEPISENQVIVGAGPGGDQRSFVHLRIGTIK